MYKFKESDAYDFARQKGIKVTKKGDELTAIYCPYCQGGKKRDKGTWSINLTTGQFKCFRSSCGVNGNMITLSKDFDFSLGHEIDEYYRPKKAFKSWGKKKPIIPKPKAIEYLESRGISAEVADKYGITVRTDIDNVLVFPFYDSNEELVFIKYRKIGFDKTKDKNKEWCQENGKPILFGISQCNKENKTLICTEGMIDSLSCATAGIENCVSVPTGAKGFTFIPYCWDFINSFEKIIIFGDCERGEITLLDEFRKRFGNKVWNVRRDDYKGCKDANEILQKYGKEQLKICIENAEQEPIKRVIDLCEVENVNPYLLEKLQTGIEELDTLLYGGLPYGLVHILAGSEGDGKSTFASQIIANAVSQNVTVFSYSGELPNYMFKNWLDFQIAGQDNIVEVEDENGKLNRYIAKSKHELIEEWYRGKIYLYDANKIKEADETEHLLLTIDECIKRYGVRLILLDNLMTGIYADDDITSEKEENQMQIKFVMRLRKIALQYNVVVLLLVHKSKAGAFITNPNNAISGSKKITNIAGIVMTYDRYSDKEIETGEHDENERKLIVSKNRIFGKRNMKGIPLFYNEKSKRIYGIKDNANKKYAWEKKMDLEYGFKMVDNDETPFD